MTQSPVGRRRLLEWPIRVTTALFCQSIAGVQPSFGAQASPGGVAGSGNDRTAAKPNDDERNTNAEDNLSTRLLIDPVFKLHATGKRHPERPERIDAVTRVVAERPNCSQKLGSIAPGAQRSTTS